MEYFFEEIEIREFCEREANGLDRHRWNVEQVKRIYTSTESAGKACARRRSVPCPEAGKLSPNRVCACSRGVSATGVNLPVDKAFSSSAIMRSDCEGERMSTRGCRGRADEHTLMNNRCSLMSGVGAPFVARLASRLKPQCYGAQNVRNRDLI